MIIFLSLPLIIFILLIVGVCVHGAKKRHRKTLQTMRQLEWQRLKWENPELYNKLNKSLFEKLIKLIFRSHK